jgi:sterol desaturase/sphingolipid hydroxylase (fatty acid hydroxylase superfamily)
MSRLATIIVAAIGTALMTIFVIGLSHSISTGFAGFWGGFPFMVIVIFVIALALYDFWEEAIKRNR